MTGPVISPVEAPALPLRTERLVLRLGRPEDLDAVQAYWGDPEVTRYLPFPVLDRVQSFRRLARLVGGSDPRAVGDALTLLVTLADTVVGDVMLRFKTGDPPAVGELGWVMHPAYAGRGLATEAARAMTALAFDHYGLHRVEAQLDPRNEASAALCRRLGMQQEAHLRRDYQLAEREEWADTAVYGLLREEWSPTP